MLISEEIKLRPPLPGDIDHLAKHMRQQDVDEVWASNHLTPKQAIQQGITASQHVVVASDGDPFFIYGIVSMGLLSDTGVPWALGTDKILQYKRPLLSTAPFVISRMLELYARLCNHVDARNTVSVRWLQHMGFTMERAEPYGPDGVYFHKFTMVRDNV